ncbi:MAG: glycyl-radical enzyme activating protein [Spirochaetae bacterium HGW-Spirochaetae-1]|jgi:pyruvate formate lyase activating enzyme|nr:MAG: glycyl-radical enzyme activating protein [Spirochaetae bacterium HGW-Spirochaetae-1]
MQRLKGKVNEKATGVPLILEIKGNSLDDGPGIRSVIFFKGCPLDCAWCHNPESKKRGVELSFDAGLCIACDACIGACTEKALSRRVKGFVKRDRCTLCFQCTDVCPSGALSRVGRDMTVDQVVEKVKRDIPFYNSSGGGVTLSGGEPTVSMEYLSGIVRALKAEKIHTLIETCGLFDMKRFSEMVYPHIDSIYFDIKFIDEALHRKYCGTSNKIILENFSRLQDMFLKGGISLLARTPLIPGITDSDKNLSAIAGFLSGRGVQKASLLAYNPLWHEKNGKIGVENRYSKEKAMKSFMKQERIEECWDIFLSAGIEVV